MTTLRVAVCQLECHPALFTNVNYLSEPFVPLLGQPSISLLSRRGLDVEALETLCREQYLAWHEARTTAALQFLQGLSSPPDVVLFPEVSIPLEGLRPISEWSALTGSVVLAGSHTPRRSPKSLARYVALGVGK